MAGRIDELTTQQIDKNHPDLTPEDIERFGPDPLTSFKANLAQIHERIEAACKRAGRNVSDVRLLPITKTVPENVLRYAFQAGIVNFGENKIQEASRKQEALQDLAIKWSIVGHLQTNKVKYMTRFAHEFHALDSLRLAGELNKKLALASRPMDIYIQVNTSREESKFGMHPDELIPFIEALEQFPWLKPRGLMTLAALGADIGKTRACFRLLRDLRDQAARRNGAITALSMGMSGDFEEAIEEGATIVRVGQAIFGTRPLPDSHYWPETGSGG